MRKILELYLTADMLRRDLSSYTKVIGVFLVSVWA
jgi:hypothetical protein